VELYESNTHPFIVKIWLEETVEEAGRAVWRGHITHVPSGERRYIEDLSAIIDFVQPYLEELGIRPGLRRQARSWFKRSIGSE
jgi:hypothetical protein